MSACSQAKGINLGMTLDNQLSVSRKIIFTLITFLYFDYNIYPHYAPICDEKYFFAFTSQGSMDYRVPAYHPVICLNSHHCMSKASVHTTFCIQFGFEVCITNLCQGPFEPDI